MAKEDKAKVSNEQVMEADAMRERIANRAYELYEQRGRAHGLDAQDWLQAELEILGLTEPSEAPDATKRTKDRRSGRNRS